ncbi:MAG: methylmalonyl Co-A mutase-associated GTPase MeaB [Chloroflexota bacterium]|nr:methylmalonyl Co-A mutase-associated GTPase MeaB [Chloroflexota bacterium]
MPQIDPIAIRQGDRLALSRALTAVENNTPQSRVIQSALFPYTGHAHLVGITGATGTGKSTLVNQLAKALRHSDSNMEAPKVAIIAVDPTSPFTGGALLGDRIRMQDLAGDKGIFIRSMASRGALGGLAHQTAAFVTLLDAAGYDLILIETVGAGQTEVDISRLSHTVVLVEAPGLGDDIQAIKAGIMEIADILVVNKADLPGAAITTRALQSMLDMAYGRNQNIAIKHMRQTTNIEPTNSPKQQNTNWEIPVLQVTATEGKGIDALITNIMRHKHYLMESGLWQRKESDRLRRELEELIQIRLVHQWQQHLDKDQFDAVFEEVIQRKHPPLEAVEFLFESFKD